MLLIDNLNLKVRVVALGDYQAGFVAFAIAQHSNGLITTNAVILGAFIVVAFREARRLKRPAEPAPAPDTTDTTEPSSIEITGSHA